MYLSLYSSLHARSGLSFFFSVSLYCTYSHTAVTHVLTSIGGLFHPEYYFVSDKWLESWENNKEASLSRLRTLSSPDHLLFLPSLDGEIEVHLGHTLCRVIILTGAARTGKTEWLQKRLPLLLRSSSHQMP
jgi:hypothetical protein